MGDMPRKIVITVRLVPDAARLSPSDVERDVERESPEILRAIPWAAEIERMTIVDK